jgi:hypothetical protein
MPDYTCMMVIETFSCFMEDPLVSATMVDDISRISFESLRYNIKLSMECPLVSVMIADDTSTITLEVLRDNVKLSIDDPSVPRR